MKYNELLCKYSSNQTLESVIKMAIKSPSVFVKVKMKGNNFIISPEEIFLTKAKTSKCSLELDKKFNVINKDCGCLQFYRNGDCIHTTGLYGIGLMNIDYDYYTKEVKKFIFKKEVALQRNILTKITSDLNNDNEYFGKIHLLPVIEFLNGSYYLSLKIGYDKDYVIKDISEFIYNIENNVRYEYGQKLNFIHSYECLDDVSKELYNFITNIANTETVKSILIRKPQLLKILEIYPNNIIYFSKGDSKTLPRRIVETKNIELVLNADKLIIVSPNSSKKFVCGVNFSYFIDDEFIYAYKYKNRLECKLFEALFKLNSGLNVGLNSNDFIAKLLPLIKNQVKVLDEFYEKYPLPNISIKTYLSYESGSIILKYEVVADKDEINSPYIKQILEGYFKVIESNHFYKNSSGIYSISNVENQYKFLTSDLSGLKGYGDIFFEQSIKNIKVKKAGKTNIKIVYNVGLLDFNFENTTLSLEELKAILLSYHQKLKFVKLKDDTIIEIDEEDAKRVDNFLEDFNISIDDLNSNVSKPLNYILKLVHTNESNVSYDDQIFNMIRNIQNYKNNDFKISDNFKKYLRSYQIEGYKWLKTLAYYGFGGILADDMGLGKTLQILAFISSDDMSKPSIIVCPMSLVYNWENECKKWGFDYPTKLILGGALDRENIIKNIDDSKKILYITSYDSLRRDIELYKANFRFIIADEAQFIKNQNTLKSEAIKLLKSDINLALTGTPIENGLADLWSIFDFLMSGYLSSYNHFKTHYETLIAYEDYEALSLLKKRVTPFILRRTKKDVLKDLPDKIEDTYYYKMDSKQKEIYDAYSMKLKEDLQNGGNNTLALLTRLRQICITPELIYKEHFENTKIDMCIDLIKSSISGNHRILLFSQFTQSFDIISKELDKENIKYFILQGETKAKDRMRLVEEFNSNKDIKVFIISLKAGGTGLNLIGADMVIHLDPWWNSSAENQAADRAYRIGQTKNVYVAKLICKGTIEEKVLALQKVKKDLADSIINSDVNSSIKITKDDILSLLEDSED